MHENVSTKVAKTYTFVTEVIEISVEIASMGVEIAMSIAEVISMRASATPTWMKRIQKTLAVKKARLTPEQKRWSIG